jgi:exonuclease VII small subunit
MNGAVFVVLLAQAATPTPAPTPTPPVNILAMRQGSETQPAPSSLGEIAKKIKLRLPANQPRLLTNESVKQLSEGVELTTSMMPGLPEAVPQGGQTLPENAKKAIWQERYKAAVVRATQIEAEINRLTGEVSRLESSFYSTDDPAQRDGVIKPAWDKAVADLRAAQAELEQARKEPDQVLDQARRDGAEPGWFRGLDEAAATAAKQPYAPRPTPTPPRPRPGGS